MLCVTYRCHIHRVSTRGHDQRPEKLALSNEDIPKGAARILNAAKIQEEWRKKRKLGLIDEDGDHPRKKKQRVPGGEEKRRKDEKADMQIMPGESLAHFNRYACQAQYPVIISDHAADESRSLSAL